MRVRKYGSGLISEKAIELTSEWSLVGVSAGKLSSPNDLDEANLTWNQAIVPGTVAHSLQVSGEWKLDDNNDFDDQDWWYRCKFNSISSKNDQHILQFNGLATFADVWLNGKLILNSSNMFLEKSVDVTSLITDNNDLVICFKSLSAELSVKRPRPQWKTNLVSNQQLRWFRTTLLGSIPGWTPPVTPIGPWRSIIQDVVPKLSIDDICLNTSLKGKIGVAEFSCRVRNISENPIDSAILSLSEYSASLNVRQKDGETYLYGEIEIDDVCVWWPHTHGVPYLYHCTVSIISAFDSIEMDCGHVGFKSIELVSDESDFTLLVNGKNIFFRGACWTIEDIVSLSSTHDALLHYLTLAVEAGMNMVRIGGTMVYESEHFYNLCDKLGIMVWQDFMFANMDYPVEDPDFVSSVRTESTQLLRRLQTHPSVSLYCGNSEVEQQAAMFGMPREIWENDIFSKILPELCQKWHKGIPYISSTPTGGCMPFNLRTGVSHYYGVGAYLRPITDVKSAGVRFASECLGFSNIPEQVTVDKLMGNMPAVTHHPKWKKSVPRDNAASWDFEMVRDHYLCQIYGVEPEKIKFFDNLRYFELSRSVTGEVMSRVFQEWRSSNNPCQGGLVWFYKDIMPGAGWGIIDSEGVPKSSYYYLKRVWSSQAILLTDEGLNGIDVHILNEYSQRIEGCIELKLIDDDNHVIANGSYEINVSAGDSVTVPADEILNIFYDVNYSYRFGQKKHSVVLATLLNNSNEVISEAVFYPQSSVPVTIDSPTIVTKVIALDDSYHLILETDRFLTTVHLDVIGYLPDDNYFCLIPGRKKTIRFKPYGPRKKRTSCYISALNMKNHVKVVLK